MDGTEIFLDLKAALEILKLYKEDSREMFEEIIYLWSITQEYKKEN